MPNPDDDFQITDAMNAAALEFNEVLTEHTEMTVKLCITYSRSVLLDYDEWLGSRCSTPELVHDYLDRNR